MPVPTHAPTQAAERLPTNTAFRTSEPTNRSVRELSYRMQAAAGRRVTMDEVIASAADFALANMSALMTWREQRDADICDG